MGKKTPIKNLVKSVNAIVKQTKAVTKAVKAPAKKLQSLTKKRSYTVRDLPIKYYKSPKRIISELESKSEELDKLRKPGEMWAFEIGRNKSLYTFETFELMVRKLTEYKSVQINEKGFADALKFVKFKATGVDTGDELDEEDYESTVNQYRVKRERNQKKNRKVVEKLESEIGEIAKRETGRKPRSHFEASKALLDFAKGLQKQNEDLNKRLAELEKLLKGVKKGKKSAPKKSAPKKTTPKKASVKTNVRAKSVQKGTGKKKASVPSSGKRSQGKKATTQKAKTVKPTTKKKQVKKGKAKK